MINPQSYHDQKAFIFLGIGGIGMSALARYLLLCGKEVKGYDRSRSEITQSLEALGAEIVHSVTPVPSWFEAEPNEEILVIWTPALASDDPWMLRAKSSNVQMIKRAELLGVISAQAKKTLAVAGTHGKTTTSSLLAHITVESGDHGIGFMGGVAQNYQTNLIAGKGIKERLDQEETLDFTVVEADEFDRSFHWIKADIACITSMDPDHLDVYQDADSFNEAFEIFVKDIKPSHLFIREGLKLSGVSVGLRRFNQHELSLDGVLIDDYAHHPTELLALLQGVREFYPDQNHVLLFQPHLFSRTRDFGADFARVLKQFDRVILMPIYPARELPLTGINSDWLAEICATDRVISLSASKAIEAFIVEKANVYIMAGAGDIGTYLEEIKLKLSA
ncbi:MAG: hypothetical protein EBY38_02735 [Flavobacteriaceae bacterium]|nr:hypothetical protein [Flavobacteriaceae bacterium]